MTRDTFKAKGTPPAEAHCATCSCVPGMTPAIRFDTTPAECEREVRDHLIRMGWTPPSAPVGVEGLLECLPLEVRSANGYDAAWAAGFNEGVLQSRQNLRRALSQQPTPVAPVGVERLVAAWEADIAAAGPLNKKDLSPARFVRDLRALAQQPASVDGAALREVVDYLCGIGELEGRNFGDDPPCDLAGRRTPYWWREHLRRAAAPYISAQPAAVDGVNRSRYMQKLWLDEWLSDHDIEMAADAYAELLAALAAQPGGSDNGR